MTKEEVKNTVQKMLEQNEPEIVAQGFIKMYLDGKIEIEDLLFLVDQCGFELDEEFVNASREEQKKLVEEGDEEDFLEEADEKEEDVEEKDEGVEVEETEERASKTEDYNGEKVYDKKGNPEQVEAEDEEKAKAEKLYNLKF